MNHDKTDIFVLPGVPGEMKAMLDKAVIPAIKGQSKTLKPDLKKQFKIIGLGEAELEDKVKNLLDSYPAVSSSFLAKAGIIKITLQTRPGNKQEFIKLTQKLKDQLSDFIFTTGKESISEVTANLLAKNSQTIASIESITGGLIGKQLTDIAGSSSYYSGGLISYSPESKIELLQVPRSLIAEEGTVSKRVAKIMAVKGQELFKTDIGLAVTGYAGPTADKGEVGRVYAHLTAGELDHGVSWKFTGNRMNIRWLTAQYAINLVRKYLLGELK